MNPNNLNNQQIIVPDDFPMDMQVILAMVKPLVTEDEFADWVHWSDKDISDAEKAQLRVDMYSFLVEHQEYLKAKELKEQRDRNQSQVIFNNSQTPSFNNISNNNSSSVDSLTNVNQTGLNINSGPQANFNPNFQTQQFNSNPVNSMSNPANQANNNFQNPQATQNPQINSNSVVPEFNFNPNFNPNTNIPDFSQFTNSAGNLQPNFNSAVNPVVSTLIPVSSPLPTNSILEQSVEQPLEPIPVFNPGQFNFNPVNTSSSESFIQEPVAQPFVSQPVAQEIPQEIPSMQINNQGELVTNEEFVEPIFKESLVEPVPVPVPVAPVPVPVAPVLEVKKEIVSDQSFRSQNQTPRENRPERNDRPERVERSERSNNQQQSQQTTQTPRENRPERNERTERTDRPERAERSERSNNQQQSQQTTQAPRENRPERNERTDKNQNNTRRNNFNPSASLELDELYTTMNDLEKQKLQLQSAYYEKQQGLTQRIMELESKVVNLDIFSEKLKEVSTELNAHSAVVQDVKTSIGNIGSVSLQAQINNLRDEMRKTYREISYDLESVMREFSEFRLALSKGYQKMVAELPESRSSEDSSTNK
jgi:hypothetical protein